ncbi:hypothetical protein D3C73_1236270 [compost metagenome]|jgi:hypothetical protein
MGVGYEAAECPVPGAVVVAVGEYDDAAPDLGAVVAVVVEYCQVHPYDGVNACVHACFEVFDGAV